MPKNVNNSNNKVRHCMEKESNFELIYLFQTEAQSCYGCGTKFIRNEEQHNLIVRKYCEREYVHQEEKK
jgi:hypothetical protein